MPDVIDVEHQLPGLQEVMFGSRPTAIYAQHLKRGDEGGGRKHHGWRGHHPLSRSGGHSHKVATAGQQQQQRAACCAECGEHADSGSQGDRNDGGSGGSTSRSEAAAEGSGDGSGGGAAGEDSGAAGKDGIFAPGDVTWNVISAEQPDSSSDGDNNNGSGWRHTVQRHRKRGRDRSCAAGAAKQR